MIDFNKISKWLLRLSLFAFWASQICYGILYWKGASEIALNFWQSCWYKSIHFMIFMLLLNVKHSDFIIKMFQALALFALIKEFSGTALVFMYNDFVWGFIAAISSLLRVRYANKKNNKSGKYTTA